ncbi:hypothetical protein Q3G72_020995 [Acer saccharum]|nr:hypothetical protein Q3G72_020995 [Acer saccharum]
MDQWHATPSLWNVAPNGAPSSSKMESYLRQWSRISIIFPSALHHLPIHTPSTHPPPSHHHHHPIHLHRLPSSLHRTAIGPPSSSSASTG